MEATGVCVDQTLAPTDRAMNASPRISVLMPVYNAESYLAAAVESILAQTWQDFEFLIMDDGSSDRTPQILQAYAQNDPRIHVYQSQNQGVSAARNSLLQKARGEYVAVMDADDIALPHRLAAQIHYLDHHPEIVCVGGSHDLIDEQGRFLTTLKLPETDEQIQALALAGHGSICHPCACMRRSPVLQVGGYDERLKSAHDLDLWLKLGEVGQLTNLPEVVLQYRIHTQSVSGQNFISQRQEAEFACQQAWERRGIAGTFEASEPWRPGRDRPSRYKFMLQYGWWAFNSHQRQTAAIYGVKTIGILPWRIEGWILLGSALLKPLPSNPPVR